jgi:hypothetical protein
LVEEAPAVCWIPWQSGPAVPRDAAPSEFAGGRERTGPSQLPARRPEVAFAIVSPLVAPSGQKTPFVLEIRNITDQTIPIVFDDDPLAFAANASNEDATTLESDCSPIDGLVIGPHTRALRLFLRPHGAVRKTVTLDATQRVVRRREPDGACVEEDLGPLPPGNYTLEIALPASWLPTESDDRVDPFVRAPIRVTAAD